MQIDRKNYDVCKKCRQKIEAKLKGKGEQVYNTSYVINTIPCQYYQPTIFPTTVTPQPTSTPTITWHNSALTAGCNADFCEVTNLS